jgi:hypothetical protein
MAGTRRPHSPLSIDGVIIQSSKPCVSLLDFDMNVRTIIAPFLASSDCLVVSSNVVSRCPWTASHKCWFWLYLFCIW